MSASSEKVFFLALYEFVQEFDRDDVLTPVVSVILDQGRDEQLPMKKFGEQALEEMNGVYEKIKKYVDDNEIKDKVVLDNLADYLAYDERRIESSIGPIAGREGELSHTISMLVEWDKEKKHLAFVRQFATIRDDGYIEEIVISPSYIKWEEEKKKLERLQVTRLWYSWDQIVQFYQIYKDFEKIRHDQFEKNQFFSVLGTGMLFEEIKCIFEDKLSTYNHVRHWDMEMYKTHMDRVYTFTRQMLSALSESPIAIQKTTDTIDNRYSYDKSTGILIVNEQEVKFRLHGNPADLLAMLTSNKRRSSLPWDEIYKKLTGAEPPMGSNRKEKQKIYDMAEGVVGQIAKKAGAKDFLEYDLNRVRINPVYSRLEK